MNTLINFTRFRNLHVLPDKALVIKLLDWVSTVLIVGPAALMAFYSPTPPMVALYTAWIVGSLTASTSAVLRKSSALFFMNATLLGINVYGLINCLNH